MAKAFKISGTFRVPKIDKPRWLRETEEQMTETLKQAAAAWLTAATAPIPTWSGASLGTFSKLAAAVDFQLSISPTTRGAAKGLGAGAGESQSTGRLEISAGKGDYGFEYSTTLRHLIFNEFNNANVTPDPAVFSRLKRPGPYQFQEAGRVAFEQVAAQAELPIPRITVAQTIKVK
jgi:hypothetical protein